MTPLSTESSKSSILELDGLRGLAIALVMLFHLNNELTIGTQPWLSAATSGWMGVDLFFILSGYLITESLLRNKGRQTYWRNFIINRARRIVPAYAALCAIVFVQHAQLGLPWFTLTDPVQTPLWHLTFVHNMSIGFRTYTVNSLTMIMWSLNVEVQFYAFWLVMVALCSPKQLATLAVGIVLASPVVRYLAHSYVGVEATYYWTICRLDSLMFGALASLALRSANQRVADVRQAGARIAPVLVVLLGCAAHYQIGVNRYAVGFYTLGYTAIALSGACVFLAAYQHTWPWMNAILRLRPLRHIGAVSYGLYLFHPLANSLAKAVVEAKLGDPRLDLTAQWGFVVGALALAWLFAEVSWHIIEKPFLKSKH